ncbi:MAG: hypothetical protein AAGA42_08220 [Actinomycetota bacterium]
MPLRRSIALTAVAAALPVALVGATAGIGPSFAGEPSTLDELNTSVEVEELADRRITSPTPPSTGAHAFLYTNGPGYARWDPCTPIKYQINSERATPAQEQVVFDAIEEIELETGLDFAFLGRTTAGLDQIVPPEIDALIVFGDPASMPILAGNVLGIGGGSFDPATGRVTTGYVAVNTPSLFTSQIATTTVQHEIGHLVGLAHVSDPRELMFPEEIGTTEFGPGDREGLWRLGAAQGCFPSTALSALLTDQSAADDAITVLATTTVDDLGEHGHHHHHHHHHHDHHDAHHHEHHHHRHHSQDHSHVESFRDRDNVGGLPAALATTGERSPQVPGSVR